ncbi:unnamed protein product [marine sediment metagenome]|uniref:Uncharacterized protein n=1 Tax=marine sediment metagenome TaxID=412755 RepID=X1F7D1_9ZZZZ
MVQQKESVLLTRWLAKFLRTALQWKRVRLGIPANPEEAKLYSVLLRWADAIFIEDGFVNIVESKLRPELGAIGQLEGYKELFKVTPEFVSYENWPIKMILLSPVMDLGIAQIATKKGITYEIWKPPEWK